MFASFAEGIGYVCTTAPLVFTTPIALPSPTHRLWSGPTVIPNVPCIQEEFG